jgi:hypothetical protein
MSSGSTSDVVTDEGTRVPQLELTRKMIEHRTMALYGPSGSGKTVIVKGILDRMRGWVDQCIVVAPTEPANESYRKYIPSPLIHYSMSAPDPKNPRRRITGVVGAVAFLELIWARQEALMTTYRRANKTATLTSLFQRVSPAIRRLADADLTLARTLRSKTEAFLRKKLRQGSPEYTKQIERLDDRLSETTGLICKRYIAQDFDRLWAKKARYTEEEQWALTYLEMRPGIILVFDDCAAEIAGLFKKAAFRKLFYQNRHYAVTVIFAFQDDTDLAANFRKNAFVSVFCTEVIASAFFQQTSNRFSKDIKALVHEISPPVFAKRFRKLAYIRDDPRGHHFYHYTGTGPEEKMFPSDAILELCRTMKSDKSKLNPDNPYYQNFAPM